MYVLLKKLVTSLLTILVVSASFAQGPTNGYPPAIKSYGNQFQRVRADSAQHVPHKYSLTKNTTDSTPQVFAWSTPSGDSLVLFVNGQYKIIGAGSGGGGGGGSGTGFSLRTVTSSNFSTTTNCPLPALNGDTLQIYWNDLGRYLVGGTEWTYLAGGGFTITYPGFDATAGSYSFSVYANNGSTTPGPLPVTSASFSNATDCPLTSLNGMQLQIYWNDANRYLVQGSEWTSLAGGGFTVTIPGFNSGASTYQFFIFNQ